MSVQIVKCECGQENQLVMVDGELHFDVYRHGNGEPWEGRCFNCCRPLSLPGEVETVETEEPKPVITETMKIQDLAPRKKAGRPALNKKGK